MSPVSFLSSLTSHRLYRVLKFVFFANQEFVLPNNKIVSPAALGFC